MSKNVHELIKTFELFTNSKNSRKFLKKMFVISKIVHEFKKSLRYQKIFTNTKNIRDFEKSHN